MKKGSHILISERYQDFPIAPIATLFYDVDWGLEST
jgi:hypothetical protein